MTGPEHYREAEALLRKARRFAQGDLENPGLAAAIATEAQAHATLALAAATALAAPTAGDDNAGLKAEEWDAWAKAAATHPEPVVEGGA
jgi:hypothetical protein